MREGTETNSQEQRAGCVSEPPCKWIFQPQSSLQMTVTLATIFASSSETPSQVLFPKLDENALFSIFSERRYCVMSTEHLCKQTVR